ncbi:MAG: alpha/beta hydrolase [Hyphomicrobiaceae bacterium]
MTIVDRSTLHRGGRVGFLLVHGLGGTPVEMRFVAQGLARAGYTVSCCQLAGHCAGEVTLRESTWKQWYASVEAAHDALKAQCDVVIAGGLSMGGLLAAHLALQRPGEVHGLTFYAPTLWMNGWTMPWYARILRYIYPTPLKIHINLAEREPYGIKDERIRSFVVKSMLGADSSEAGVFCTPVRAFANFNSLVRAVKPKLPKITAPTLIIHPRHDDIADLDNAMYLQRHLGGMVDMVVLDDSYHIVTLDKQRNVVIDKTVAFAQGLVAKLGYKEPVVQPVQMNAAE